MKLAHLIPTELVAVFVAAFLGASVALAHMPGLSWRQQLVATMAGGLTAGFLGWGMQDLWHLSAGVTNALTFVAGLVAFRATPALMNGFAALLEGLPGGVAGAIVERIKTFGIPK